MLLGSPPRPPSPAASLAGADPQQSLALVAVGLDTTQPIMNALAGYENGIAYKSIMSDLEVGRPISSSSRSMP